MSINYYAILGVSDAASAEEIRRAYYKAAMAAHPDRGGSNRLMQRINEAWEVLGDTQRRRQYDAQRQAGAQVPRPVTEARSTKPSSSRPGKSRGKRPPTFAGIAGSLVGRAFHAVSNWMEPTTKTAAKGAKSRTVHVVECRRCGQKLRVKQAGAVRIRCPHCHCSQAVE